MVGVSGRRDSSLVSHAPPVCIPLVQRREYLRVRECGGLCAFAGEVVCEIDRFIAYGSRRGQLFDFVTLRGGQKREHLTCCTPSANEHPPKADTDV
eukprot:3287225-Prymnesium_polylepis.1